MFLLGVSGNPQTYRIQYLLSQRMISNKLVYQTHTYIFTPYSPATALHKKP